jgi:DNA-directed RNA polymerase
MVTPPKPWSSPREGGYLRYNNDVMRTKGMKIHMEQIKGGNMVMCAVGCSKSFQSQVYKGLNVLSETGWKINPDIYKIVQKAWAMGGGFADLPSK